MKRKKERASYSVRFPLCGFVRPASEKQPTVETDFDAHGPIDLYMCKIDCLECDRRLGALEMRKRYEQTHSHDARWSDAIGEDYDYTLFQAMP